MSEINWRSIGVLIRRAMIIGFALLLVPHLYSNMIEKRSISISDSLERQIESGEAATYTFNRKFKVDGSVFQVNQIVVTQDALYLYYVAEKAEPGWSFPSSALKLTDENGSEFAYRGETNSGRIWGSIGEIRYDKPSQSFQKLTITFEWYDRKVKMELDLADAKERRR